MDDLSAKTLEAERDGIVSLLRAIADRLASLAGAEAYEPLRQLRDPVTTLRDAAVPLLGTLPTDREPPPTDPAAWPTVVFVQRGQGLDS